jgi:NAD(P) transhydrogenase subunit alpha
MEVVLEQGAGDAAGFADRAYGDAGARIVASRNELFATCELIAQVRTSPADRPLFRPGQVLVGLLDPLNAPLDIESLAECGVTAFALELVPRSTRAQSMDALSSMATVAGYKAVLLAAAASPKMFPLLMTAAGTVRPARVFVVGAGVAGLQAIATARRLGAVVCAYDVRPAAWEQIESLGAQCIDLGIESAGVEDPHGYARALGEDFYRRQREAMARAVAECDVVIATAAVPGERAPVLLDAGMLEAMRPGSVIIDLAAERGGNCELTRAGETVLIGGVALMGPLDLAASVPHDASLMYARNVSAFLAHAFAGGRSQIDSTDEIVCSTLVTHQGKVVHPRVLERLQGGRRPEGCSSVAVGSPAAPEA